MPWPLIGFVAAGFFSGSILYSLILPKWIKGVDIVAVSDDHNPGTANAMKYAGKLVGSLCLICDLGKGFFPVWIAAQFLPVGAFSFALVMAAPVMGHAFSPMLRGRGGKAIAATFGVLLGLFPYWQPVAILVVLYIFFSVVVVIRPHRLRTIWTFTLFAAGCLLFCKAASIVIGCVAISAVVLCRHLSPTPDEAGRELVVLGRKIR